MSKNPKWISRCGKLSKLVVDLTPRTLSSRFGERLLTSLAGLLVGHYFSLVERKRLPIGVDEIRYGRALADAKLQGLTPNFFRLFKKRLFRLLRSSGSANDAVDAADRYIQKSQCVSLSSARLHHHSTLLLIAPAGSLGEVGSLKHHSL